MALGTDSGFSVTPYGVWHARELELLMTYAGLTSLEAIQAGTSNGALMLGLEGRIGVVAPGMIADLIVVDGDPVADITVLQRRECIETVIQNGKVVVFNEEQVARSWPHDRGITYSVGDLTYDVVHGRADPADPARGRTPRRTATPPRPRRTTPAIWSRPSRGASGPPGSADPRSECPDIAVSSYPRTPVADGGQDVS